MIASHPLLFIPTNPTLRARQLTPNSALPTSFHQRNTYACSYGILKVVEIEVEGQAEPERIVHIRNPWGAGLEWDGKWSDEDPGWSKVSKATQKKIGVQVCDDGTWFMSFADWAGVYEELQVCRLIEDDDDGKSKGTLGWWTHRVLGEWAGDAAQGVKKLKSSPQFQLIVEEDCEVCVEISQPSVRPRGQPQYTAAIATQVMAKCKPGKKSGYRKSADLMANDRGFSLSRARAVELQVTTAQSPINIIPSTLKPHEGRFTLCIYTSKPSKLIPLE